MTLLVATRNHHKLEEIRAIWSLPGVSLAGADDVPGLPDVVEDADTFEGNALKKACALCAASGRWTLADDSGLEVDALGGSPGVHSARYAGRQGDTPANNAKLLQALAGVHDRRARFRCVLALAAPDGRTWTVSGACEGRIIDQARGDRGFGYDPLFVPDGHDVTFAELPAQEKNRISHRARALAQALRAWSPLLAGAAAGRRPRLLITTDIGGDPDDTQSMIRLLVYANAFEIEGLLATSRGVPGECADATPRPDLILALIAAYEEVLPNLRRHAAGWPEADALRACTRAGKAERGRDAVGAGRDTAASEWIIRRVDAGSPSNPLNIAVWGGQTELAQALWRVRHDRGRDGLSRFVPLLRIYDINDQDRLAAWLRTEFPGLRYIHAEAPAGRDRREGTYRGMYLGGDESLTSREWVETNVRSRGPLGALYPAAAWTAPNPHACLKEGDTPSWFFFLPAGGNDPDDPAKPGWGGQFQREADGWYRDLPRRDGFDPRESVYRHRPAFQADFARRMRWCVE